MARTKRISEFRDTNIRLTPNADRAITTIRAISHKVGYDECPTQSEAVNFAVIEVARIIDERYFALKSNVQ